VRQFLVHYRELICRKLVMFGERFSKPHYLGFVSAIQVFREIVRSIADQPSSSVLAENRFFELRQVLRRDGAGHPKDMREQTTSDLRGMNNRPQRSTARDYEMRSHGATRSLLLERLTRAGREGLEFA
jgi:hypothetical protein